MGAAPVLDFSVDDSWIEDPAGDGLELTADIEFQPDQTKTTIPLGIRDDESIGDGTNTLVWVLDENANFGFKKEVYFFSEDDDTKANINVDTFKSIPLVKGSDIKAVIILIEDNDGAPPPIKGTDLNDTLTGTNAADTIYGFQGDDAISGLDGDDNLYGFEGDDEILGGRDNDYAYGLSGHDTLSGSVGNDVLDGGTENDDLDGGHGADRLFGWLGKDSLIGGKGTDELYGEADDDDLDGGDDDDLLDGGTGRNDITTGEGADIVVVRKNGVSIVSDFEDGSDRLQLTQNLTLDTITIVKAHESTQIQFQGEALIILRNTDPTSITEADFTPIF